MHNLATAIRYVSRDSSRSELYVARTNRRGVYSVALFRMTKIYPDTKKNKTTNVMERSIRALPVAHEAV